MITHRHAALFTIAILGSIPLLFVLSIEMVNGLKGAPIKYRIKAVRDTGCPNRMEYFVQMKKWYWPFWHMPSFNRHIDQDNAYKWLNRYLRHEPPHKKIIYLDEKGGI